MSCRSFTIPGEPRGKERPRFFRGHAYTPAKTRQAEKTIASIARAYFVKPLPGMVVVEIRAQFTRPAKPSHPYPTRGADVDNIAKMVLDALNGIAYNDDRQVAGLHVVKTFCDTLPGTWVAVSWVEGEE